MASPLKCSHLCTRLCIESLWTFTSIFVLSAKVWRIYLSLTDIFTPLDATRIAALPGFHAIHGCDAIGRLFGKWKLSCWKVVITATEGELHAVQSLGSSEIFSNKVGILIGSFHMPSVPSTCAYQSTSYPTLVNAYQKTLTDELPSAWGSLTYATEQVNFQALIWRQNDNTSHCSIFNREWRISGRRSTSQSNM